MKLDKKDVLALICLIILILVIFIPDIIGSIPSSSGKLMVRIILLLIGIAVVIYSTYSDVRKKQFTTTRYIVLVDIVTIIFLVILFYAAFCGGYANFSIKTQFFLLVFSWVILILRGYLRSDRFERN